VTATLAAATPFEHRHAAHCESGVIANLLSHYRLPITESLAFGLSSALAFAYLPFVKLSGLPLIAYRMPPRSIIKGLLDPLAVRFAFETFASPEQGERRLDALLAEGRVVGLQTSVYWLPYFPPDMRFHFNAHNLLVYGKDGGDYLVSDPVFEAPVRCAAADLSRARFAKGVLAPKGLLYYPRTIGREPPSAQAVQRAIRKTTRVMLAPLPMVGVRGMRLLARKLERLSASDESSFAFIGHIVRMQEEIGTGGAGFRFIYAAFLQEAAELARQPPLAELSERLLAIGDGWRAFALAAARMVKGRDALAPSALSERLREQAAREESFFRALSAAV